MIKLNRTRIDFLGEFQRMIDEYNSGAMNVQVKPTPHRFRHPFARILLQRGLGVKDVADLLGNTETVVLKSDSAWVPERQKRIVNILKEAFDDKPKPRVVAIR